MNYTRKNILTIDCEDFLSLPAFKNANYEINWDEMLQNQINLVLDTLHEVNDTKATFFIVGEIAMRNPELIKRICQNGHHIGSHSNVHDKAFKLSESEFEKDLIESIGHLSSAIEGEVNCYRAPMWSFQPKMNWFWKVLSRNGIKYDSSIFPISKFMYGNPGANRFINRRSSNILEFPPSTFKILGFNIPFCGGIYFRFLPYFLLRLIIKRLIRKYDHPIIMYFHPWELDPNLLRFNNISPFYKFILYYNTKKSLRKFVKLINEFHFTSIAGFNNSPLIK